MTAGAAGTVRRIRVLDATLANQIAAGEVVERPASVLKELLENSLDAGARRVRVEVAGGGAALVQVTDDGRGIARDELALALERHATSKIASLDELESVASLGFRGEALPSIASVSRLRVESRAQDAEAGWCLSVEGGAASPAPQPSAHPSGTTVAVRDLFFNTPVRRRFLRTARTEFRHLDRVFRRAALSAFPVAMTLVHDGREVVRVAAAGSDAARRRRVGRLLGAAFLDGAVELDHTAAGLRVWGWLGASGVARERAEQQLYVNGRPVSDATVRHAVRLGYGDAVPPGLQPAWLLFLELDAREVDVNVHPTKQEVRFREARTVHDFVRSAVRAALAGADAPAAHGGLPADAPRRARGDRAAPPPRAGDAPAAGGAAVLGIGADGVLVVRDGDELRVASACDLRRDAAREALRAAAGGGAVGVRPLLIPERIALPAGSAPAPPVLEALARLGIELRVAGETAALLLAVPEVLAAVAPQRLADVLASPPANAEQPERWVDDLAALAAAAPLSDRDEARRLWDALRAAGERPGIMLDAAAVDRLRRG